MTKAKPPTITEVRIPLAAFRTLRRDERNVLLTFAHAFNEMSALMRIVMVAQNQPTVAPIHDLYTATQAFTLQKVLAGKLYECWNLIKIRYFDAALGRTYDDQLLPHGREALAALKKYFGRSSNIIALIRNEAAFHYSRKDVSSYIDELVEDDCRVYLSDTVTTALYWVGEQPMRKHLLTRIDPDHSKAVTIMSQDVSDVSKDMGSFFVCVLLALIAAASKRHEVKAVMRQHPTERGQDPRTIRLPIFLDTSADDALELKELIERVNRRAD
jgi:hypothetical protein